MERGVSLCDLTASKQVICSLLMFLTGLLFTVPLIILCYFTYYTIVGKVTFCTLWIDIPGRLAIFLICYYTAGVCGFFPLPRKYRLKWFRDSFQVWSLNSWRSLFRNLRSSMASLSITSSFKRNTMSVRHSPELPLLQESNRECFFERTPIRRRAKPIRITYPKSYVAPVFVSHCESSLKKDSSEDKTNASGSLSSIDASIGGIIVPMMKEKSSKFHFLKSNKEELASELPDEQSTVSSKYLQKHSEVKWTGNAADVSVPILNNRMLAPGPSERPLEKKSVAVLENEMLVVAGQEQKITLNKEPIETKLYSPKLTDKKQMSSCTAQKSRKAELKNHPRFPWFYLRNPIGVPEGAKKLHKKNIIQENRDIKEYVIRQKQIDLEKRTKCLLASLRNEGVCQASTTSYIKINLTAGNSFQTKSSSRIAEKSSDKQMQIRSTTESNSSNIDPTKTRSDQQMQRMTSTIFSQTTNIEQHRFLSSQFSNSMQKKEMQNIRAHQIKNPRRTLPSQRFQVQKRPQIRLEKEKLNIKCETPLIKSREDSVQATIFEAGPSNLTKFTQDTEQTGILQSRTDMTANKSCNWLQMEDLKKKQINLGESEQITSEVISTQKSEVDVDLKSEVQTTDTKVRDVSHSDVLKMSNASKNPDPKFLIASPPSKSDDSD